MEKLDGTGTQAPAHGTVVAGVAEQVQDVAKVRADHCQQGTATELVVHESSMRRRLASQHGFDLLGRAQSDAGSGGVGEIACGRGE
ncbi:hypothetical protein ABIA39_008642 [Nocardia sp. GAS34]|uniref:hypothetical protein n=1 Tax=unclassified Nocardia TaxID=2637762 RepID=UPI003D23C3CF